MVFKSACIPAPPPLSGTGDGEYCGDNAAVFMNALSQLPDRSPDIGLSENPGYNRSSCDAGSSQGGKIGSVNSSDGDNRNGDGLADGGQSLTGHRDGICFGWTWKYSAGTEIIGSGFFCFQGLGNGFGGYAENLVRSQQRVPRGRAGHFDRYGCRRHRCLWRRRGCH